MVGRKTEKSRFRKSVQKICTLMRGIRHETLKEQADKINQVLRGHYAYYGMGGNIQALERFNRIVRRYWRRMLCSRSQKSWIRWDRYEEIAKIFPLQRPKLYVPYKAMQKMAVL